MWPHGVAPRAREWYPDPAEVFEGAMWLNARGLTWCDAVAQHNGVAPRLKSVRSCTSLLPLTISTSRAGSCPDPRPQVLHCLLRGRTHGRDRRCHFRRCSPRCSFLQGYCHRCAPALLVLLVVDPVSFSLSLSLFFSLQPPFFIEILVVLYFTHQQQQITERQEILNTRAILKYKSSMNNHCMRTPSVLMVVHPPSSPLME